MGTMTSAEIELRGEEAIKITKALSSETAFRLLRLLSKERLDISTIAARLKLSESYVSEEVSLLEKLRLLRVDYAPGKRGIRKICELAVTKITIVVGS